MQLGCKAPFRLGMWTLCREQSVHKACGPYESGRLNVHIVPHSHDDAGWLKTVDQYFWGGEGSSNPLHFPGR